MYWHRCWNLFTLQLQITRVDPFNNGSCHSNDSLEDFSVYKEKTKGSKYSVQVCLLFSSSLLRIFRMLNPRANEHNIVGRQLSTLLNVTDRYMLRPSAHPFACCCVLLGVVAQSLKPFKLSATYKRTQQLATLLHSKSERSVLAIKMGPFRWVKYSPFLSLIWLP